MAAAADLWAYHLQLMWTLRLGAMAETMAIQHSSVVLVVPVALTYYPRPTDLVVAEEAEVLLKVAIPAKRPQMVAPGTPPVAQEGRGNQFSV
jgi:hypothetical protein